MRLCALVLLCAGPSANTALRAAPGAPTTLNLSQDLVALGIAASNMLPNQPSLDAGPLFVAGVNYAKTHGMTTVVADKGTYHFLGLLESNAHFALSNINGMTIDLQGSELIFTHPLYYGMIVYYSSNVVIQNFTADYQPVPFTQVRVVSVDTTNAQLHYTVEPGWVDPASFNINDRPAGSGAPLMGVYIFRTGQPAVGVRWMFAQLPITSGRLSLSSASDQLPLGGIRAGDVAVVGLRSFTQALTMNHCNTCTVRNVTVYSSANVGVQSMSSPGTVMERVYSIPKPGTDRLVSTLGLAIFPFSGPNNTIRLSRSIRTMDDGIILAGLVIGAVQSQVSSRRLILDSSGGPSVLGEGDTVANGTPVDFQRLSDGAMLGPAVIVSQSIVSTTPRRIAFDFDRDLPAGLVGNVMYSTDANQNGAGTVLERSTVQSTSPCCKGIYINGLASGIVRGNYIRRSAFAGIFLLDATVPGDAPTAPLMNLSVTNNVVDGTNMSSNWWWFEFGAIQSVTLTTAFDLMTGSPFSNLNITGNFLADAGRSGVWLGNTNGGSIFSNYLLNPNVRPDLANAYPGRPGDALRPLVVDTTSKNVATSNNIIDTTSGRLHVTDPQYSELAAYAPGATLRLNAYNVGALTAPTVSLIDADGVMTAALTIKRVSTHAIDVQLPSGAALGGAYITLTSGSFKYFGTLFVDSQDNIPAVNGCVYEASLASTTVFAAGGTLPVLVVTQPGCAWQVQASNAWVTGGGGTGTGLSSAAFAPNFGAARSTTIEIAGQPFTVIQSAGGTTVALDRGSLIFGGVSNGVTFTSETASQSIRLTQSGPGTVTWTAAPNVPWLIVSPTSGTGPATLNISVQFQPGLADTQSGLIALNLSGAANSAGPVSVTLKVLSPSMAAPPFGSFDTPSDGATGIAGSVAVTGWALDDVQVTRVTVCRDASGSEAAAPDANCGGQPRIYIGDAVLVEGARTDVQAAYPALPLNTRAGWGYLLLSNFLPGLGNGTFVLRAYAYDADGHTTLLGSRQITCSNATSAAPFGAIDVPGQGAVVSGVMSNIGWVLAPAPAFADPPDGGTVHVFVDGIDLGDLNPGLWTTRSDLQGLFSPASYPGIGKALGVHGIDTTTLTNGVHTIFWIVTGTGSSGAAGIGSRFFTVSNGTQASVRASNVIASMATLDVPATVAPRIAFPLTLEAEIGAAPMNVAAVRGRRGFDLERPLRDYPSSNGRFEVQAEELDRVELHLSAADHHQYSGYLRTPSGLQPLPIGSTLDASSGVFTWMPGVGFHGAYELTFVDWSNGHAASRQDVRITLNAKGSNRVGPQTIIDIPTPGARADRTFVVAGWAADLDSGVDSGVSTVHVWAYPLDADGNRLDPAFIGPATYGLARPDVAEVYGDRFKNSGYGIVVNTLQPGTYDIAVFGYSTVVNSFTPARVARVVVR